ncbi:ketopantoate reductase PanE/ApbA C terminal-domain-containing protein [Coniella lustricola]|uniref:Ketopantoate reductase PanE/ApbA C terminal-domain-containing protein n=1 Tax=Coniella lustricola TaxID=2025994 RepID=A0A2T3ADH2_9PEZI|nr:ketopantoate reductase PanE/ApbA C terminal-domain-containing protein [Coniella lustricola]
MTANNTTTTNGRDKARVLIVGSGGVGTMAAYTLEKGGLAQVTSVLRSNYAVVKEKGFQISSIDHGEVTGWRPSCIRDAIPNVVEESLPPFDYVIVSTKNIADVPPSIAEMIAPAITPSRTAILLLQNGINIERPLVAAFPSNPVLSGISVIGAKEFPPGTITQNNYDISYIGPFSSPTTTTTPAKETETNKENAAAHRFVQLYSASGAVDSRYDADVAFNRWRKLLYNASFNSVCAILRTDTARLRASQHAIDELVRPVMLEIAAVAKRAAGVSLSDDLINKTITIDLYASFFKPSMCQDVEKGNLLEFENIVGEPLREAARLGVETPTLKVLYSLLKSLQFGIKEMKGLVDVPRESSPALKYGDKNERW